MADSSSMDKGGAFPHVLRIYFIPFPSPGHIIPMVDIAKLFAERGADATVVLTPLHAARFGGTIARAAAAGNRICLHVLPFPSVAGLPDGSESTDVLPSRSLSGLFARALDLLRDPFDRLLRDRRPDAVVSDVFLPWTGTAAAELGVPRYAFTGTGCFALSVERSLHLNRPQDRASSDSDPFLVPGLPDRVYLTRSRLGEATLPGSTAQEFLDRAREADRSTAAWVVNTFPELEPGYLEHYERETGKRVFAAGPFLYATGRRRTRQSGGGVGPGGGGVANLDVAGLEASRIGDLRVLREPVPVPGGPDEGDRDGAGGVQGSVPVGDRRDGADGGGGGGAGRLGGGDGGEGTARGGGRPVVVPLRRAHDGRYPAADPQERSGGELRRRSSPVRPDLRKSFPVAWRLNLTKLNIYGKLNSLPPQSS